MTDVRDGAFRVLAGQDLTGKEGYLVKMSHNTGVPKFLLPVADGDLALYAVVNAGEDGEYVDVEPLAAGRNARLKLKGACNPGDMLILADTSVEADRGKVRGLPDGVGTYRVVAIAEEKGAEGQLVLCRPAMVGLVTIVEGQGGA